jgi:hypothetical protein
MFIEGNFPLQLLSSRSRCTAGLYQIMFLDWVRFLGLLLFVSCSYFRLVLKLLWFSASSYKGTAGRKLGMSDEREEIRFLIDFGSCLIINGGDD